MAQHLLIPTWLKLGRQDASVREAINPSFSAKSFRECETDHELLERFIRSDYPAGTAFYIGDLCFIFRHAGHIKDWIAIRGDMIFDRITFSRIIESRGMAAAQENLDLIRTARECPAFFVDRRGYTYLKPRPMNALESHPQAQLWL